MLENIYQSAELIGLSRKKSRKNLLQTIPKNELPKYQNDGWYFVKNLKNSIQIKREKAHDILLKDKIWSLFFKMNFTNLSGDGGGVLTINPKDPDSEKVDIDIIAIDNEVAIAIQSKSFESYKKYSKFQEEVEKFSKLRETFSKAVRTLFSNDGNKRQVIQIIFINKIILSDDEKEKARTSNIILFDEKDLAYYEHLVSHLGPAAKYQILADMIPGKEVPGLEIKIPAIKCKMGGYNCYTFSISPEYLLKISYVSHRSKGKASDINTYQRMLAKSRLNKIKEYISDDGIFPTNVILNFEKGRLFFQKIKQETELDNDIDSGVLGWLNVKPAYKSAWVIDGQHRLFAYSGHEKAFKSKLSVLAFEGLKPSVQAELFIDINAKQKSVKRSLLQELFAELHWDADEPSVRISAIVSKAIQDLNNDPECQLHQRIQTTDGEKDQIKCITLTSLFSQIEKKGFFIVKERGNSILEYGPLWGGDDNAITLKRTVFILKEWVNEIVAHNKEWWDLGSGEGGGLAMNDGIATMLAVLRSVFETLEKKGHRLVTYTNTEVSTLLKKYATTLGQYLAKFDSVQRKAFRDLRGAQGVVYRTRQCQQGIRTIIPEFNPEGLDEWINLEKQQTNKNAKEIIDQMEIILQDFVVDELKRQYGVDEELWWYEGVPGSIRGKVTGRMEEDKNKRGGKEYYFDLIDYKKIIQENWEIFENTFAFGKGNKGKKTEWLDLINETRKIVAHASSGKTVSIEDFTRIREYYDWLKGQIAVASVDV
jgi:DGQHR domain-containing protein